MKTRWMWVAVVGMAFAGIACSTEAVSDDEDGEQGAGAAGAAGPSTPEDVPSTQLEADPSVDCPANYVTAAPVLGANGGFDAAGQTRSFELIVPDPTIYPGPRPLFVGFHGTSESGSDFIWRAELRQFVDRGFVVIAPDGVGNGTIWPVWDAMHSASDPDADNKDLALFDQVVRCVAAHHPIDQNRIYIGGHSAGGIMANYLLQRRSDLLAGGIVGSGVFSLTEPKVETPLEPVFALVTWGGDNDAWGGAANSEVAVPEINFVEQAAIASQFYAEAEGVGQVYCRGDDVGHAWLDYINGSMIEMLLAHPKGLSGADGVVVPQAATNNCANEPYAFESNLAVICPADTTVPGCEVACQLFADCAVENATVGPILGPQLTQLGFSGPDNTDCTGCVSNCENNATTPADASVLSCIDGQAQAATCGPGIDGALPAIEAINVCCEGRTDSPLCQEICTVMMTNSATESFLPTCVALVGG